MNTSNSSDSFFQPEDVIHRYTRSQAIEDGILIDVSTVASEAEIKYPVAITCGLWSECVELTEMAKRAGNDESGRLWDILWMLHNAIKSGKIDGAEGTYEVLVVQRRLEPTVCTIKAVCGPGDTLAPVITLMLPGED
jgi:hypothetical protein